MKKITYLLSFALLSIGLSVAPGCAGQDSAAVAPANTTSAPMSTEGKSKTEIRNEAKDKVGDAGESAS